MPPNAPLKAAGDALPGQTPIRVMIVDDSAIARSVLARMISGERDIEVVALAGSASQALETLRSVRVDIVILDIQMPGRSGLEALPAIIDEGKGAKVLIVSSTGEAGMQDAVRALGLGAADTLPKPGAGAFFGRFSQVLQERLRRIGRSPGGSRQLNRAAAADTAPLRLRALPHCRLGCLALGASTGGIHAIGEFLGALPQKIGAPILVTQHLPQVFTPYFAREVEAMTRRAVRVAEEGMRLEPDVILIAPGDAHLGVAQARSRAEVRLSREPAASGSLPSVDPMFASAADTYGRSALGVVFSGIGKDGLAGSARLVDRGGAVLVQDAASSAVWGMPKAIAEAGLASAVLAPAELARRITAQVEANSWR